MHFIQSKQFSKTNVTSHSFQKISDLMIFPECFHGPLITLWRATCGPLSCSWTTLTWPTMTLFHQQQWRQIVTWVLQYNI